MTRTTADQVAIKVLPQRRFGALARCARHPATVLTFQELEWYSTEGESLIGVLTLDRIDQDFGWIILGRDERFRFRAVDVGVSLRTADHAREQLHAKLAEHHALPDEAYHQVDSEGAPMDFPTPMVEPARLSPTFKIPATEQRYSPVDCSDGELAALADRARSTALRAIAAQTGS